MKYLYPVILASTLLLQACAPTSNSVVNESVETEVSDLGNNSFVKDASIKKANVLLKQGKKRDAAQAYFKAAGNYPSPQRERVILQAAEITAAMGDASLTNRYLSKIPAKALVGENGARYGYIKALLALQLKDPNAALKYLPQSTNGISGALVAKINQLRQSANAMGGKESGGTVVNVQAALIPTSVTKIGVLLPQSGSLGSVSQDIYQGMKTAKRALGKNTELTLYDVSAGGVAQYQKAVADGADVIVGPLDKETLADILAQPQMLSRPILSLNYLTSNKNIPGALYQFGLLPEDEARQVANNAIARNQRNAIVLAPNSSWGERVANAFKSAYQSQGGQTSIVEFYPDAPSDYSANVQKALAAGQGKASLVFVAASPSQARLLRPLLSQQAPNIPVYATSHIFSGRTDPVKDSSLDGIVYTEIPWIMESLQAGTLNSSTYPRMYALGMDAFLIAQNLPSIARNPAAKVNGKTGMINLAGNRQVQRSLLFATFANGVPHSLGR
jgi:hypothetical protein